jgi:hypothetical protein
VSSDVVHAHELKRHNSWLDEEYLCSLDQSQQGEVRWVRDKSQSNADNSKNVRREASRHLKAKIEDVET